MNVKRLQGTNSSIHQKKESVPFTHIHTGTESMERCSRAFRNNPGMLSIIEHMRHDYELSRLQRIPEAPGSTAVTLGAILTVLFLKRAKL